MILQTLWLCGAALALLAAPARAEWEAQGNVIADAFGAEIQAITTTDGAGGFVVFWRSEESGLLFGQRFNEDGLALWPSGGVILCVLDGPSYPRDATTDANGNTFLTWGDFRDGSGDIYVQKLNPSGSPQWTNNGVRASWQSVYQQQPRVISDGSGGVIVGWEELRTSNYDIYAQRISTVGSLQWGIDGSPVTTATGNQQDLSLAIVGDEVVFAWSDRRGGQPDIYSRNKDLAGNDASSEYNLTTTSPYGDLDPTLIVESLDSDYFYMVWIGGEDSLQTDRDVFVRRYVFDGGTPLWYPASNLSDRVGDVTEYVAVLEPVTQELIVSWAEEGSADPFDMDVSIQRIRSDRKLVFENRGTPLFESPRTEDGISMVLDGEDGAIVACLDFDANTLDFDTRVQRVNALGQQQWAIGGQVIPKSLQVALKFSLTAAPLDGARLVYQRYSGDDDLYVTRIEPRYGRVARPEPRLDRLADVGGDQGGRAPGRMGSQYSGCPPRNWCLLLLGVEGA